MRRAPRTSDAAVLLLRARARPLLRRLPPAARRLVRAVPALLEGVFQAAPFDGDPPGVEGKPASRAARSLAVREAGAVVGWTRGRRAITALFLVRTAEGVGLEALCAEGTTELQRSLARRLARIDVLLRAKGLFGIRAHTAPPEGFAERLAFGGGLLAGVLTPPVSAAVKGALDAEVPEVALARLLPYAATPLGRVALSLGTGGAGLGPALRRCAARGLPLLAADPELGLVAWCAERGELGPLQLLAQLSPRAAERLWATDLLHAFGAPRGPEPLTLGRTLALRSRRRLRAAGARRSHLEELWGGGVPALLQGARIDAPARAHPSALQRLRDEHLRLRLSGAAGPVTRRSLELRLEPAMDGDGGLVATAVLRRPVFQPSLRRLSGGAVHQLLVKEALAGTELSVSGATRPLEALAASLQRTAATLRQLSASGPAPALHIGGLVHFRAGSAVRTVARQRFTARPRRTSLIDFDGHARSTEEEQGLLPTLRCEVSAVTADRFMLSYRANDGQRFEERVDAPELDRWLQETASLLRSARAPTLLSVRRPPAPRAFNREAPVETVIELELDGDRRLRLVIAGERFGGASELGWRAAAQTLLSTWPPKARARVMVGAVRSVWPLQPLELLYVRSVAVRRLAAQVRMCRP